MDRAKKPNRKVNKICAWSLMIYDLPTLAKFLYMICMCVKTEFLKTYVF